MSVEKINKYLEENGVVILPGFQGISKNGDVTTIEGRFRRNCCSCGKNI